MTTDGRDDDTIRVRVSLGLVGINLSLATLAGLWALRNRRVAVRPCARVLAPAASLGFATLALIELTVPLFVVEPDRVRRNHRLVNRQVSIDGPGDLDLGKGALRRRSDGRVIETTLGARRGDVAHLRHVLDHVESGSAEAHGPR